MTSARDGFLSSDAVGIIAGQGDRIDRLERYREDPGEPAITASYYPQTTLPGTGEPQRVGSITLPRGYSRLTVACFFQLAEGGDTLTGAGITFPPGWEDEHVVIGGFTDTSGLGSGSFAFRASGIGLMRSSARKSASFYARGSSEGGTDVISAGTIMIEPVGSIVTG